MRVKRKSKQSDSESLWEYVVRRKREDKENEEERLRTSRFVDAILSVYKKRHRASPSLSQLKHKSKIKSSQHSQLESLGKHVKKLKPSISYERNGDEKRGRKHRNQFPDTETVHPKPNFICLLGKRRRRRAGKISNTLPLIQAVQRYGKRYSRIKYHRHRYLYLLKFKKIDIDGANEEQEPEVEQVNETFILTGDQEKLYRDIIKNGSDEDIVVTIFNADISRKTFRCLRVGGWLNDDLINAYLKLLRQQSVEAAKIDPQQKGSYFHSSFFYTRLMENNKYTYDNVQRWTKRGPGKCDLFQQAMVFVPINVQNNHWTLCVVHIQENQIRYYDSLGGRGKEIMSNVLRYVCDEAKAKLNKTINRKAWKLVNKSGPEVPKQNNDADCGVFVCAYALYLSKGWSFDFSSRNMPAFRKRLAVEIYNGAATQSS